MTSVDNTGEVVVKAISRRPSRNNSTSSLCMVQTPTDYTPEQQGGYFTHSRSNNVSTSSNETDSTDTYISKIAHDKRIKDFNATIRGLRERVEELEVSLNVAEVNYNQTTKELESSLKKLAQSEREKEEIISDSNTIIENLRGDKKKLETRIKNLHKLGVSENEKLADLEGQLADKQQELATTQDFLRQSLAD